MAVQLDNGGAAMLREKILDLEVGVHTSKATTAIVRTADGLQLNFADGGTLQTVPQRAFANRQYICVRGPAVVIDTDTAAFADCQACAARQRILRADPGGKDHLAPGYHMARTAAAQLAGEAARFSGADMSTKLKLLGVDVASFGDAHGRTAGCQSYQWTDGPRQIIRQRRHPHRFRRGPIDGREDQTFRTRR
jgi:nitrite reductase (NADH) large subunit